MALGVDVIGDLQRAADDRIGLALSRVFDRARAFLRGYLEGGYVEAFFRNDVPRLELGPPGQALAAYSCGTAPDWKPSCVPVEPSGTGASGDQHDSHLTVIIPASRAPVKLPFCQAGKFALRVIN
jgi:hypothetical protein